MSSTAAAGDVVHLGVDGLTVVDLRRISGGARVQLAPEVEERIAAARAVVERALEGDRLVYGLNTGLGSRRNDRIPREHLARYQVQMVVHHAGGVGPPLPDEDVRAIMAARIAGMARGGSGAHPGAVRTLLAMLNAGVHPVVPEVGSVGASDLMHMAAVAMVVMGRGHARLRGTPMTGAEALSRAGIAPHELRPKDGLALLSANGASIGLGALTVLAAEQTALLADTAGALTLEAIAGNPGPFEEEAVCAKPLPGQIAVGENLRALLAHSELLEHPENLPVQDPLSFRVLPQVHGALRDRIRAARDAVEVELNAVDDSPLVSVAHDRMISTGNFHPMELALAFESLRLAIAHAGVLSERRMNKLVSVLHDHAGGGFDAEEPGGYALPGLVIYSAAALLAELKQLAAPVTLDAPPLDLDVEDHATLAPQAVTLTRRALVVLETILAIEVLVAIEGLSDRSRPRLGDGTSRVHAAVRGLLDRLGRDASTATVVETVRRQLLDRQRYDAAASTGRSSSA